MGFIRKKEVKGNEYYYYCERRRSRVKDGGNGKVISIEKLLGSNIIYDYHYLPFWLWDGLPLQDFIDAYSRYHIKNCGYEKAIAFEVTWQLKKGKPVKGKITFRAVPSSGVDARGKVPRSLREFLQTVIDSAIKYQDYTATDIDRCAYYLALSENSKQRLIEAEERYRIWKRDPDRRWVEDGVRYCYREDYGDDCLWAIEILRDRASEGLEGYLSLVESLVNTAPATERERFKAHIIQRAEKLAARPNFIDWYETTYHDGH